MLLLLLLYCQSYDRLLVTTWGHDPAIISTSNILLTLNDALSHSAILVQVSTVSRTGIYRVHITLHLHRVGITLHLLVSVVQLLTGVIAVSTNGTRNISMTVCSLVCSTEPQVEK